MVHPGEPEPCYRLLLVEEMDMLRSDTVVTFSDDMLESEKLMKLLSDNAYKEIESGEDTVEDENDITGEEENDG